MGLRAQGRWWGCPPTDQVLEEGPGGHLGTPGPRRPRHPGPGGSAQGIPWAAALPAGTVAGARGFATIRMKADDQMQRAEQALLAAGARQYVKAAVQDTTEELLSALEAHLGSATISPERTFATLGGVMAMRRLLRAVDRDIQRGQDGPKPPSR